MWVKLNERKKREELRQLLGLEPVSLMIKKSTLRWFGHVGRKDDNDWVNHIAWEVEGIRQTGCPKKTWWDCVKNNMESLGLSKRTRCSRITGEGELRGHLANPGLPGKMDVKTMCICVCVCVRSLHTHKNKDKK